MSSDDDANRRYQDILRRIAQRKHEQTSAPTQSELAAALDSLNAAGLLAAIKRRPPAGLSAYGPKTFNGLITSLDSLLAGDDQDSLGPFHWTGSLLWHKPKGYFHYQTLGLLGIWAIENSVGINVVTAEKVLNFNMPVFNSESYYHHIKRRFDLFYDGDASPPAATGVESGKVLYSLSFDSSQRLALRETLEHGLRAWCERQQKTP